LKNRGNYADKEKFPQPGVILLDLNMPLMDGREALAEIKGDPKLKRIPIIVLTTSQADEDINETYGLGITGFITKPMTFSELVKIMKSVGNYWFESVTLPSN
jgi:CheY-like chemotaxis protein